jgi:site-specific DNA-methyltransferase (adenine-specific)
MAKKKSSRDGENTVNVPRMGEKEIHKLLTRCERLRVTRKDLQEFDDSSFIESPFGGGKSSVDVSAFLSNLESLQEIDERKEDQARVIDVQGVLFTSSPDRGPASTPKYHFEVSRQRFTSLIPLVIQAFTDIRDGWSTDYTILHPEKNLDFLQRCWRLGAAATPEELNWTLMNARKDGKLAGLSSVNRYSITKKELDHFSFAAEMALRELQDKAWVEEQRETLSLDKLLCSPRLSAEFDALAKQVAPGHSALEYRWAAMTLRKARRLAQRAFAIPLFEDVGYLEDTRPSRVTEDAGVYWVVFEDRSAFVGVAESLRLQIESFVGSLGAAAVPAWLPDRPVGKPHLRYLAMPHVKLDDRERMRSAIFRRDGSRLNFKDASLFTPRIVA